MSNIFNEDFQDFLIALNQHKVEYVLVGGYSVILHGYPRTTGDMDILVRNSSTNYHKLVQAFNAFGMPVFDMTEHRFINNSQSDVFTFGRQPSSIDIMTAIKGSSFEEVDKYAILIDVDGISIKTIHLNQLLEVKRSSGRYKDLDDIEKLTGKS